MKTKLISIAIFCCCILQTYASEKNKSSSTNSDTDNSTDKGIFAVAVETNLIKNPGFENNTSKWSLGKYNGGSGLFSIDSINSIKGNQSAIVNTANNGKDYEDVQLFTFFNMQEKAQYSITFEAKVKSSCAISVSVSNGFEIFYEAKFNLRPDKQLYGPFVFNSKQDDSFSFFSFNLGKTNTEMLLDEVNIQADHTNRQFENVVSKSGINIHFNKDENLIYINSPTEVQNDLPIILYDAKNNVINTNKIVKGYKEANIKLNTAMSKGNYFLKVFTSEKFETFDFVID